jgi:hypothetical protein
LRWLGFIPEDLPTIRVQVPPQLDGRAVQELSVPGDIAVAVIVRRGEALLPTLGTRFETVTSPASLSRHSAYARFETFVGMRP